MDINEILEEAVGANNEGEPKSIVSISHKFYNSLTETLVTKNEYSLQKPIVDVVQTGDITQIQLSFDIFSENDLRIMWNIIQKCNEDMEKNADTATANEYHLIIVTIVPQKFGGREFIVASAPLFVALQADNPGEKATTLNMVFQNDDVEFFETDEINEAQIASEVAREIAEQERIEELAEKKRQEREEFLERRNKALQRMRGYR